jgi:3',5'-cyclic AMP phosphodiesterase CpdA
VTARILHVSDLHIGRREAPEPVSALRELADALRPGLVVATGDLAHRGRRAELERAAELLRSLGPPVLAVPGNHDLPYSVPARFTRTYAAWCDVFGTTEPVHASGDLVVVGTSSARPWRQQGGALARGALGRVATHLRDAPRGSLRVVALHHHLAAPPWIAARKRPVRHRDLVLQSLAAAGAELVVGGHVHQAGVSERREFEALEDRGARALVLATAPGLGRPRPRRRGEARGVNGYEWDAETLTVTTYSWDGGSFSVTGRRSFARE